MKKFKTLLASAMILAVPVLFASCDDDPWYDDDWRYGDQWWSVYNDGDWGWSNNYWNDGGYYDGEDSGNTVLDEAEVLNGEWDGTMTYTDGDTGERSQFYANMTFVRNNGNAIKGTGTEVDYTLDNSNQIADQQTLKFNWYIDENTGDIYIHYLTSNNSTFVMDIDGKYVGFYLDEASGTFQGYMTGTNNKDLIYIDLRRQTNNEAKPATRSINNFRTFGTPGKTAVTKSGSQKLNNRR